MPYLDSFTSRKMLCVIEIDGNNGTNDAWKIQCVGKKIDISRERISFKSRLASSFAHVKKE